MASHEAWMLVVLVGISGCDMVGYGYRKPCEEDAPPGTCCPLGSHEVVGTIPELIICAADEPPCPDAGADAAACSDAGDGGH